MKNSFLYFMMICLLLAYIPANAQNLVVKGQVFDQTGEPLPGVSISVKGTTLGTITGADGDFSLNAPNNSTLLFSFIGYQSTEKKAESSFMKVVLKESTVEVDEVVVTALGIKKEKKALAYSVTEVKGEEMNRVKTTSVAIGLAGKVAGVNVVKPATGVMGSSRIVIRGNGSLNGNNQPLYVIDGVPMDNSGHGQADMWGGNDGGDGISSLNSEDIESMSVLKGGTAAALYGSRAANGAIVITTKKGVAGKVKVEYGLSYTNDQPVFKNDDFQWEYGCGANGLSPNQLAQAMAPQYGMTPEMADLYLAPSLAQNMGMLSYGGKLDGSMVTQFDGVKRPYVAAGRNNFKNFYENGWALTNNIAVSGGNEQAQYRVAIGDQRYHDLYPNSRMERDNVTLNLNAKPSDKFSLQANVMYVRERSHNRPNLGDIIMNGNATLWLLPTNIDVLTLKDRVDKNGGELLPAGQSWISNPYFVAYDRIQKDSKDRVIGALQLQYNFTPHWYLRGRAGGDMINRRYTDVIPYGTGFRPKGSIVDGSTYNGEFNVDAITGYNRDFEKTQLNLDAFVGWNTMVSWYNSTTASGQDFVQPGFNAIGNTGTTSGGHYFSDQYINSIFGQVALSWRSMLYLNMTGRNDWFSSLAYKNKNTKNHIFYPSVGLGFILSQAVQMPEWIPFLKLRGSWAESGGAVGPYQLGLTYNYNQSYNDYPIGSINTSTIPNLNLKPLTSISYEGGLDARFFNNRLGLDVTYYVRNTKNDIVSAGISAASGYRDVKINAGKVKNHGVELLITATPVQNRHFIWNSSFNFSYNKSEVKQITNDIDEFIVETARTGHDGDNCGPAYIYHQVGQPYGIIKGRAYKRNEKGEIMFKNGLPMQGEIEKLGESVAPYAFGFNNSFEYRNFRLSFLIDAKFGNELFSMTNAHMISFGRHKATLPGREGGVIGEGVKEDGVTPNDVKVSAMQYYMALAGITEECIYDASFIKLRELSLGYTFPVKWTRHIGISSLYVAVVGRNLWNIYDKLPMIDPESSFNNGNGQGFESYGMPISRSIGFNINVKF
ncbi:MAG: SusC/RagA family TonB-linked outer membrane protein [Bacteroidales bacterium]